MKKENTKGNKGEKSFEDQRKEQWETHHTLGAPALKKTNEFAKRLGDSHDTFCKTNTDFVAACEKAEVPPTSRQAAKWRAKKGKAWASRNIVAEAAVEPETEIETA